MDDIDKPAIINTRYRQLDSLRGVAALCVLFCHYQLIFKYDSAFIQYFKVSPFGVIVNGRAAVMFFFALSGFVLSLPFISNEKPLKLIEFYTKRIFRIYPAYVFSIFFALVLKSYFFDKNAIAPFSDWLNSFWQWNWNSQSWKELVKAIFLIGPVFQGDYFNPVTWSLIVEMQMSLILPFFIIIASRCQLRFNIIFLFVIIWTVYYNQAHYLGIFYMGILCAKYKDQLILKVKSLSTFVMLLVLFAGVFLLNIHFELFTPLSNGDVYYNLHFYLKDYVTGLGACVFIVLAISSTRIANLFLNRSFVFVGNISYSFYLLHLPVLITLCALFSAKFAFSNLYILAAEILLTFIISTAVFQFIEKPFQLYGKKIIERWKFLNTLDLRK